jgi:A-macroglobulin TED domain/Alpha-2-macroglobulin family/Carboxypeptidase regulatory-like domain/MG2 domain/A-macroglobulin receptor binding domain/Alpha-2-macroglobulin bait region domain
MILRAIDENSGRLTMESYRWDQISARVCLYSLAAVVTAGVTILALPFLGASKAGSTATYSRGVLRLNIPCHPKHRGSGTLTLEVLDPENRTLGKVEKSLQVAEGSSEWQEEIKLEKAPPLDELVWHRLRYRFEYDHQRFPGFGGTESISQILRMPVLRILGQQSYLSGSKAAVRVIVTDTQNEAVAGRSSLRIELQVPGQVRRTLFTGQLNHHSTTEAQFQFPEGVAGNCELRYVVDTQLGSTEYQQTVRLQDKVGILLTTEKPIYQPGQTIHVRALALNRASHEAVGKRELVFEVEDSRGNKVFKKKTQTDEFGVASADFDLASEVNLGTYHLRAWLGGAENGEGQSAEIALNVEKYVLPKFKVDLSFQGQDAKKKRGYRPGDHVTGTVQANYFFGKPLDSAEVSIKAMGMDVTQFEAASVEGKTDREGQYCFDLKIPAYLAGTPLSQGAARLLIEASVKDTAKHTETRGEPISVSESAFLITAVPEGGTLVPNLENEVFLLASYPDGSPVQADLAVRSSVGAEQRVSTDEGGVAIVQVKATSAIEGLRIEAKDKEGDTVSTAVPLQLRAGDDQILLRTEHAVYHMGETIRLKIAASKARGTAYVDIVKEGQTILTRDVDISDGAAELLLTASPELAGTVDVNAYVFGYNAQPVADHRLIFVQPADELKIETTTDATVYKPGGDARIRFRVTDGHGQGVRAALGLQIVDQAVFALAEKQPGFAKVFFYLEQEVMKPRYEIHSIGLPDIVEPAKDFSDGNQDRAARALFSATEIVTQNRIDTEVGREIPQTRYGQYRSRYQAQFQLDSNKMAAELRKALAADPAETDLIEVFDKLARSGKKEFRDAWGTPLKLEKAGWGAYQSQYVIRSAGPDKKLNTGDDLSTFLFYQRRQLVAGPANNQSDMKIEIEHDHGARSGQAEISGVVADPSGAAVVGALVIATRTSDRRTWTVVANESGQFRLAALPKGSYQIVVSSPGFGPAERTATLEAGDSGKLQVRLNVGSVSEVVAVNGAAAVLLTTDATFTGGIAGAVPGVVGRGEGFGVGAANRLVMMPVPAAAMPLHAGAMNQMTLLNEKEKTATRMEDRKNESAEPDAHLRSYFPEALYINPEIITDRDGNANIAIPLADNITTWRMAMLASTRRGALGTATSSLKVFQDFFVDLDLPVTLTEGDQVTLPVAIYNYTSGKGEVRLQLKEDGWYSLVNDEAEKSLDVDAGKVGGSQFTLEARRIGKFKLTLSAQMQGQAKRADIVVREIEVLPNGRQQNFVFNGQLESAASHDLKFPAASIPGASRIFVRLYPGPLSQLMEGMDAILRMPGGCFEQTSSSTYPNILALDYMKRTKKLTPEVHGKAEGYIANGYQRLLTFEVPGGGFSWFGQAPANKILTAYGLMEFYDMSKVYQVDPRLIPRTQQWLASQQQADGSWKPDSNFINEGATNRYNSDVLRITTYIAWSLEHTGYQGEAVDRAAAYVQKHLSGKVDPYTLAVLANFAVDYRKDREFTREAMQMLLDARTDKDDQAWWTSEETGVYSTGASASVETTGLAAQALLKWGQWSSVTKKALTYITAKKDAAGTWGSTQATIMALRALLLATEKGSADVRGKVQIALNGKTVSELQLTTENNDLFHQLVYKDMGTKDASTVEIRFDGKGSLGYQVVGQYYLPWDEKGAEEPMSIAVKYDRTRLAQDDIATATATVRNNLKKKANMVMVDLGIPPGFDLLSEDLREFQEKTAEQTSGRLQKYSTTATQAILYFDTFAPGETVTLHYRLRAKYPLRAKTFSSRVYEYYDPDIKSVARPVQMEIRKRD